MTSKPDVRERAALLMLALVCLLALVWIAIEGINHRVPNDSQTLIGVVVTGLLAFQKDILQAIRAFWQEERVGKITDQLASATPGNVEPVPKDAADAARQTADAADEQASQIEGATK